MKAAAVAARISAALVGIGLLAGGIAGAPRAAHAQFGGAAGSWSGGQPIGQPQATGLPAGAAQNVHLDQKLNAQVSLNTLFRDETGNVLPLSSFFGNRPVLLVMPFYKCPGVCTAELDGMVKVFQDPRLKFRVGREFDVITVSIDPSEGADLAAMKKREYMRLLGQPEAANGWHFLTGSEQSIRKLADEVGFHYTYDAKTHQFAHPAGLILLTAGGKVSKYFYGVEYIPTDLRLAVTDAGQGKVGSLVDQIALYCCTYDPQSGTYSVAIFRIIQVAAALTVVLMGAFFVVALRRDFGGARA